MDPRPITHEENDAVSKEGARNGERVKISMRKCISEQIPSQKKRILGVDQLTEDSSSSGLKDIVFVKSSANDTKVTIPGVERPWFYKVEGFILPIHDTHRILPSESQRNTTDPSAAVTDSSATDYDSVDESSVCSTPLPLLKKLDAPAKGNEISLALKVHSAPAGKLKSVKIEDDPPLGSVLEPFSLLVLRRLGSIFTSGYATVQKLKKALEGLTSRKKIALLPKDYKAISLEKALPKGQQELYSLLL
ncbi:hypothetical protein Tco_0079539 [Tanacetum coccineum]